MSLQDQLNSQASQQQQLDNALEQNINEQKSNYGDVNGPMDKLKNDILEAKNTQQQLQQKIGTGSPLDKLRTDIESANINWDSASQSIVGSWQDKLNEDLPLDANTQLRTLPNNERGTTPLLLVPFTSETAKEGIYTGSLPQRPSWPHAVNTSNPYLPEFGKRGFLPPELVTTGSFSSNATYNSTLKWEDWRGFTLNPQPYTLDTKDRVQKSKDLPKKGDDLMEKPYSERDIDLIFGDSRRDYFKHGLEILNDKNPIENPPDGQSTLRFEQFKSTPFEQNDPVMFGFDIIFDTLSSPLLNGSLLDFIANYNGVDEIWSRRQVYEEFKYQFQKFFRTTVPLKINPDWLAITRSNRANEKSNPAEADSKTNIYEPGKKNYLGYYIKKISGLDFLIEQNKGTTVKYVPEYKTDMITIDTIEDVTLSMGTLAHLYKNLYWSKPNGKILFPENLLRFNCFIVVSECRNFNRVKKGSKSGNLNIIKDNVSRWVYSLKECQFYFDKMPLPNDIDLGGQGPQIYETFSFNFDFKYSTVKFERFIPSGEWGRYVGYDAGAMWKIGNKGTRSNRGSTSSTEYSIPKFFTVGPQDASFGGTKNEPWYPNLSENGVEKPFILKVIPPPNKSVATSNGEEDDFNLDSDLNPPGKDGGKSNSNNPTIKVKTQDEQNQQNLKNSNVGAQPENLTPIQVSNTQFSAIQAGGLKNLEKLSQLKSKEITEGQKSQSIEGAKNLLKKSMNNLQQNINKGTSNFDPNKIVEQLESRGITNLRKQDRQLRRAERLFNSGNQTNENNGNLFSQINSFRSRNLAPGSGQNQNTEDQQGGLRNFLNKASSTANNIRNLTNSVNQVATPFFNVMNQASGNNSGNQSGARKFLNKATSFVNQSANIVNTSVNLANQVNQIATPFFNSMGQKGQQDGKVEGKKNFGDFLKSATSFVGKTTSAAGTAKNLANQINQVSTQFFNTMGQNKTGDKQNGRKKIGDFLNTATSFVNQTSNLSNNVTNLANQINQTSTKFFNTMGQKMKSETQNGQKKLGNLLNSTTSFVEKVEGVKNTVPNLANQINQTSTKFFNTMGQNNSGKSEKSNNFLDKANDFLTNSGNLANEVKQSSTSFFNAMGQKTSQGVNDISNRAKEVFTNVGGAATSIKNNLSNSGSNLRTNLLNKTIEKAYSSSRPQSTIDLKSQLKDFLGGSLGNQLFEE